MQPMSQAGVETEAEADRLLQIAKNLLEEKDLTAARDFALLAQETEPLIDGSDQIIAITDVLIAGDKRITDNNHHHWYAILQIDIHQSDDSDLIKQQYRRLALLLHPDNNKFSFTESAFKLVGDAWSVLSDPVTKTAYDKELFAFLNVDLDAEKHHRKKMVVGDVRSVLSDPATKTAYDNELFEFLKVDLDAVKDRREKDVQNQPEKMPVADDARSVLSDSATKTAYDKELFEILNVDLDVVKNQSENDVQNQPEKMPVVSDVRSVISDPATKTAYDNELFEFLNVNLHAEKQVENHREKMPVRRNSDTGESSENIWTLCPYCYYLYEYPRVLEGYCVRCENCDRAFQVVAIPTEALPPMVPGKEAYCCSWPFFPTGFTVSVIGTAGSPKRKLRGDSLQNNSESTPSTLQSPEKIVPVSRKRSRPARNPLS